eukprot:scaffold2742_cov130-Isochrysis_galbana.AAC.8
MQPGSAPGMKWLAATPMMAIMARRPFFSSFSFILSAAFLSLDSRPEPQPRFPGSRFEVSPSHRSKRPCEVCPSTTAMKASTCPHTSGGSVVGALTQSALTNATSAFPGNEHGHAAVLELGLAEPRDIGVVGRDLVQLGEAERVPRRRGHALLAAASGKGSELLRSSNIGRERGALAVDELAAHGRRRQGIIVHWARCHLQGRTGRYVPGHACRRGARLLRLRVAAQSRATTGPGLGQLDALTDLHGRALNPDANDAAAVGQSGSGNDGQHGRSAKTGDRLPQFEAELGALFVYLTEDHDIRASAGDGRRVLDKPVAHLDASQPSVGPSLGCTARAVCQECMPSRPGVVAVDAGPREPDAQKNPPGPTYTGREACGGRGAPPDVPQPPAFARLVARAELHRARLGSRAPATPVYAPPPPTSLVRARKHGEEHGWGSIHRRYPTVDLPVSALCGGAEVAERVAARAFPAFERLFGASCGPSDSLTLRDCFVVKYEAGGQTGLAGHVDPSFLSLVMTLNPKAEFDGGGTYFEHVERTISPEQGDAVCFLGKVFHEGRPITWGFRYVLVVLVDRRPDAHAGLPPTHPSSRRGDSPPPAPSLYN